MTLTLVAEEPENNRWLGEEITWEVGVMYDLGYIETKEEWEDFKDHMCEHAMQWMEAQHNEKYHGE